MKLGLMLPVNRTIQWDVAAQLGVEYAAGTGIESADE